MARIIYCQNCGCTLNESLQFCTNCGSKVGMLATQQQAQNSLAAQPAQQHVQNSLAAQPAQQHVQNSLASQPTQQPDRQTPVPPQPAPRPVEEETKKRKLGLVIVLIAIAAVLAVAAVLILPKLGGNENEPSKPAATDGASVQTEGETSEGAGSTEPTSEVPAVVSGMLKLEKPTLKLEIYQRDVLWYTMDGTAADPEWTCAKNQLEEGKNPKWSTSDKSVATVDKNGMVVGMGAGQCDITLDIDGEKTVCKVTVENSKEAINLAAGTWTIEACWIDYGEGKDLQGWSLVLNDDTTGVLYTADGKEMQIVWYYDEAYGDGMYLYEIYVDGHRCGGRLDISSGAADARFEIADGAKGAAFFR